MYEDIFQFIRNEVKKRNLRERMVVSFDVCRQWIIFTNFLHWQIGTVRIKYRNRVEKEYSIFVSDE